MLAVQVGLCTVSVLVQRVLVFETVVCVWNPDPLQLCQTDDIQRHLRPNT